jgi:hypothetical protein
VGEGRLKGRASGREQQQDVHSDGPWFTQGIVLGNNGDLLSSVGPALQSRPPPSSPHPQAHAHPNHAIPTPAHVCGGGAWLRAQIKVQSSGAQGGPIARPCQRTRAAA